MAEYQFYLSIGPHPRIAGKFVAVISRGQPQVGDDSAYVLDVEVCSSVEEAQTWGLRILAEQPWEPRN